MTIKGFFFWVAQSSGRQADYEPCGSQFQGGLDPIRTPDTPTGIAPHDGGITIRSMQTISLKISDELLAELERAAKAKRVAKSVIVRESLETALRPRARGRTASSFDLAADLAGSIKGLPRDLAHNARYMDGFGE